MQIYSVYLLNEEGSSLRTFTNKEKAYKDYQLLLKKYNEEHPCNSVEIFITNLEKEK